MLHRASKALCWTSSPTLLTSRYLLCTSPYLHYLLLTQSPVHAGCVCCPPLISLLLLCACQSLCTTGFGCFYKASWQPGYMQLCISHWQHGCFPSLTNRLYTHVWSETCSRVTTCMCEQASFSATCVIPTHCESCCGVWRYQLLHQQ